jgi:hypothetical protein
MRLSGIIKITLHMSTCDPRLVEGYHPTTCEQFRLFVVGIWNPRKIKGIFQGMSYVKHGNDGAPQINDPIRDGDVVTLNSEVRPLSSFVSSERETGKDRPLILNFGSYT